MSDVLVAIAFVKDHIATSYELDLEYEKAHELRSSLFISFIKGGLMKRMCEDSSDWSLRYIMPRSRSMGRQYAPVFIDLSCARAHRSAAFEEEQFPCTFKLQASTFNVRENGFKLS